MVLARLAIRNLARNRRRTALTLLAFVAGLTLVTCLKGFINSVVEAQLESTVLGFTGMLKIHRAGYSRNVLSSPLSLHFEDTPELRAQVMAVPGVLALAPRISFSGILSLPQDWEALEAAPLPPPEPGRLPPLEKPTNLYLSALGINPVLERATAPKIFEWVVEGAMPTASTAQEMVLHQGAAQSLAIKGTPQNASLPEEVLPALLAPDKEGNLNGTVLAPVGLLGSAIPGDKRSSLVSLGVAQSLLRMEGLVTEYTLRLGDVSLAPRVQKELQAGLGPTYEVLRWDEIFPVIKNVTGNMQFVFSIVSGIFIALVLLGVVNSMLLSVLERTREIGTMMALGVGTSDILKLFLWEGAALGILGGAGGLLLGSLFVWVAHRVGLSIPAPGSTILFQLRPYITWDYGAAALGVSVLGAMGAALGPAWHASSLKPVEALSS